MNVALWIVQVLLAALFLFAGGMKLAGPIEPKMVYLNWQLVLHAMDKGIDLVAICHGEGKKVDAWTFTLVDPVTNTRTRAGVNVSRSAPTAAASES